METEHFNGLSAAEAERLAILAEESNEVSMACMKVLRHGYESHNPTLESGETNRQMIQREVGHFLHILQRMEDVDDLSSAEIIRAQQAKERSIGKWLHHQ